MMLADWRAQCEEFLRSKGEKSSIDLYSSMNYWKRVCKRTEITSKDITVVKEARLISNLIDLCIGYMLDVCSEHSKWRPDLIIL